MHQQSMQQQGKPCVINVTGREGIAAYTDHCTRAQLARKRHEVDGEHHGGNNPIHGCQTMGAHTRDMAEIAALS